MVPMSMVRVCEYIRKAHYYNILHVHVQCMYLGLHFFDSCRDFVNILKYVPSLAIATSNFTLYPNLSRGQGLRQCFKEGHVS